MIHEPWLWGVVGFNVDNLGRMQKQKKVDLKQWTNPKTKSGDVRGTQHGLCFVSPIVIGDKVQLTNTQAH